MWVNNLPKVATQWNSGTTRESNPGPLLEFQVRVEPGEMRGMCYGRFYIFGRSAGSDAMLLLLLLMMMMMMMMLACPASCKADAEQCDQTL